MGIVGSCVCSWGHCSILAVVLAYGLSLLAKGFVHIYLYDFKLHVLWLLPYKVYGVRQDYYVWQCYASSFSLSYLSIVLIYTHLAILLIIALILAIKTRKVKIKTLNDSSQVAALIYISSIILGVLALTNFLPVNLNLIAAMYNGGILFVATICLLLLFVPKVSVYVHSCKKCHVTCVCA